MTGPVPVDARPAEEVRSGLPVGTRGHPEEPGEQEAQRCLRRRRRGHPQGLTGVPETLEHANGTICKVSYVLNKKEGRIYFRN